MAVAINATTTTGLQISSDTSGAIKLQKDGTDVLIANTSGTITVPNATDTLVGRDTTDTLTNKTLSTGCVLGNSLLTSATAKAYNWNGLTNNTVLDFTGIPSWAKRITVMFQGISTNGTSLPIVQLGTGATPTYTTSGYLGCVYGWSSGGYNGTNYTTGFILQNVQAATNLLHGNIIISNVTGNTWVCFGTISNSGALGTSSFSGSISLAALLTAVRVTAVNGIDQFDAGTINIMYE